MTFYQIVFLFFAYSFLGWVGEVLFTAVVHRKYQDRGVLSGPLCLLYGVGGLVITFALGDIREGWFFLLVFSAVYATVIEWIGGHILEYTTHTRWWDYSAMPFNLDGYVCLGASLTWGVQECGKGSGKHRGCPSAGFLPGKAEWGTGEFGTDCGLAGCRPRHTAYQS